MVIYISALIFLSLMGWAFAHTFAKDDPKFLRKHYIATIGLGVGFGLIPIVNIFVSILVLVLLAWCFIETQLEAGKWLNAAANKKHRS